MSIVSKINEQVRIFHENTNSSYVNNIFWEITPKIYERVVQLAVTENEARRFDADKDRLMSLNGTCIHGRCWYDPIHVIFNETIIRKYMDEKNLTWIGTVHHEYSHAVDLRIILSDLKPDLPDEIFTWEYYSSFTLWSEFFARKTGFERFFKETVAKDKHATNLTSLQYANAYIKEIVNDVYQDFQKYDLEELMHDLGRFAMFDDLFPEKFSFEYLLESYFSKKQKQAVIGLYDICKCISRNNFSDGIPRLHSFLKLYPLT